MNGVADDLQKPEPLMWLLLFAYAGGALTILSPCILPVLPLVFAARIDPSRRAACRSCSAWR